TDSGSLADTRPALIQPKRVTHAPDTKAMDAPIRISANDLIVSGLRPRLGAVNLRKRWRWLAVIVLAVIPLMVILHALFGHPEPVYGGRKLSSWFHESAMLPYVYE